MGYIVHVDNSKFFRKVMKTFLSELGLESVGYDRGEDALDEIIAGRASCVITGLELADMSGEDFVKQLFIYGHPMTIIAVTASGDEERIRYLESLGVKATIQKAGDWKEKLREYL